MNKIKIRGPNILYIGRFRNRHILLFGENHCYLSEYEVEYENL